MRIMDERCDSCPVEQDRDFWSMTCPHIDQKDCLIKESKQPERPRRRNKRPEVLAEPKPYYTHGDRYPDSVRISFADGHTEIYDRRISQPSPVGYVNNSRRGKI